MKQAAERMVVALGGNALLRKGDRGSAAEQEARSLAAMDALAPLLTAERQLVITHGNGPIVGNILIRQQLARHVVPPMPLDVCGAESQGNIGYLLERALLQVLRQRGMYRSVATLLSLVEVDPRDPAFEPPRSRWDHFSLQPKLTHWGVRCRLRAMLIGAFAGWSRHPFPNASSRVRQSTHSSLLGWWLLRWAAEVYRSPWTARGV